MQNIKLETNGNILTIEIDMSRDLGESKSGKNNIIAKTGGNIEVEGHPGIKLGINCYKVKG